LAASRWLQVLAAAVQAANRQQVAALPAKTATNKARQASIKPTGSSSGSLISRSVQHYAAKTAYCRPAAILLSPHGGAP